MFEKIIKKYKDKKYLRNMKKTLKRMKGELEQCYKPY